MKSFLLMIVSVCMAFGHTDVGTSGGVVSGLLHPISGLDHILAMLGVGFLAFYANTKGYLTLVAFIGAMMLAAVAGYAGVAFIGVEEGILLSVAVIFALIGFANSLSINFIVAMVAFFGIFHGYAHGAEFVEGSFVAYMLGFSISTLTLHLIGIGIAYIYNKSNFKAVFIR
ncbi:HupE/UreJ family protein [Arcobacter sp. FWKO B]|uniref:HupE/UreJ family protein n=1 Tax=Arcobacter sp. FWKO B TaxID=2593672 RepID=UPI0018A544BF|nr:HupE/UreJ family protein [Arcobacter sp. FWKO B]QOG11987.1 HupE/UreJ family protein [Arcobacter sp. FWKO B]